MPITAINVYDRPTYQTEKVKGWDIVRIFKGSSFFSFDSLNDIQVGDGVNIIETFIDNIQSNYKGTNLIDLSKLENFDSFRITANGNFTDNFTIGWFNFYFNVLDNTNTLISNFESNYGEKLSNISFLGNVRDWYLDIEATFCIDDNGDYRLIVNGNYSVSFDGRNDRRQNVALIPFCGDVTIPSNSPEVYIDIAPWTEGNYGIKQINIDFVE